MHGVDLAPRIRLNAVRIACEATAGQRDEVVTTRTQALEKQKEKAHIANDVDVAAIKDPHGMVVIWNRSAPYFKMHMEGRKFSGYGEERAIFTVDNVTVEVVSTEVTQFYDEGRPKDPRSILIAHRNWEYRYLQEIAGADCVLRSWEGTLLDGTPVIFWDAGPEKPAEGDAKRHLFFSRYQDGSVLTVSSPEMNDISWDAALNLLYYSISHVQFSKEKFDINKIQANMSSAKQ